MNKRTILILTIILIAAGSLLKLYYIHYTGTWVRQHDVIGFSADEGQAYYIQYIRDNKSLPDFDPRSKWGLFQPPLHHIISAVVLGVSEALGFSFGRSQENIQIFTCLYMIILSLISLLIYRNISSDKNDRSGAIVTALIVAFHPIFILLSGSINNDALALILSVVSLYLASVWYEKPTYINTVLLALLIGLSMFAKLTGGLVAVPIGILMVMKCFGFGEGADDDNNDKLVKSRITYFINNFLLKICVFAAIVFPTGLFWTIRNKLKWDMPFNYIPPVGEVFPETTTMASRIFDIRTKSVFPYLVSNGNEYDEFNVVLLIIKSSLFGEYNYSQYGRLMRLSSLVLFITAIILIALGIYATVKLVFFDKMSINVKWKILLFGTYITYLLAYLYFALSSDNFSAGDFRYAAICIMAEGIFLGIFTDTLKDKKYKLAVTALCVLFAGSALVTYTLLGLRG